MTSWDTPTNGVAPDPGKEEKAKSKRMRMRNRSKWEIWSTKRIATWRPMP